MDNQHIYLQLKAILSGCDTVNDALTFAHEYIEKYPHMKSTILSYMNSYPYADTMDIRTKQCKLKYIHNHIHTQEDAHNYIKRVIVSETDEVYKKTLEYIINKKPKKPQIIKEYVKYTTRNCPHCQNPITAPETTQYIICGYQNTTNGYDWRGCGRDSCFQCGGLLCKKWEVDMLCLPMNREHDNNCCLTHATDNNYVYPDDYCKCIQRSNIINDI